MDIIKINGYTKIFAAEIFSDDFEKMFGKNRGEIARYESWLAAILVILDNEGMNALKFMQFEHLQSTSNPNLYAIRHPGSKINERYIYIYMSGESSVLLTAFKEMGNADYEKAINRALAICEEIKWRELI
jgi:hypothetical protein